MRIDKRRIYVGTNAGKIYHLEQTDKKLKVVGTTNAGTKPSWIVVNERRTILWATDESDGYKDGFGAILRFDIKENKLEAHGKVSTQAPGPCHASLADHDRLLLVSNYGGASFTTLSTETNSLVEHIVFKDPHLGPNGDRQDQAHPHMLAEHNGFVYGCDLGQDRIFQWKLKDGKLEPLASPFVETAPGSGPRHIAFHPTESVAYVVNELNCSMSSFLIDETGELKRVANFSYLPSEADPSTSTGAGIAASSDGKTVYVSNRAGSSPKGYDAIVQFTVKGMNVENGGHMPSGGKKPRQIALDETGQWFLVSNQGSNQVDLFERDTEGKLTWASSVEVDEPTCAIYV